MEVTDAALHVFGNLLEERTGQQLASARRWRIATALKDLMAARGLASLDRVLGELATDRDPSLAPAVVDALLNNETSFFRDRAPFDLLLSGALGALHTARQAEKRLAIWCAGCSTGQEVYSIAMSLAENPSKWAGWTIDLLGTDVSQSAIAQAREGLYSQFEVQRGLPVVQMIRWLGAEPGGHWRISEDLRARVRFRVHNLTGTPPAPGRFDVILCRNVLLYFSAPVRQQVFARLREAITPDGFLMLGAGETVIGQSEAFASNPAFRGLYSPVQAKAPPLRSSAA
jgi:chemotaxis protein methyltransferase CheR